MNELINAAVELMMLGMGTVFVFLVLLIAATKTMSALLMHIAQDEKLEPKLVPASVVMPSAQDSRLLRVIGEAVRQHRKKV